MSFSFPKADRLLKRWEFLRIRKESRRHLTGRFLIVDSCSGRSGRQRIGITVSRRYGNAVERNQAKRLLREAFRSVKEQLPLRDFHLRPKPELREATLEQLRHELLTLAKKTV